MSTALELVRTTEVISAEINAIKKHTRDTVIRSSIEIGQKLMEAKELVEHGSWENWLLDNVEYSVRTAQTLMKVSREYSVKEDTRIEDNVKTRVSAFLGFSHAVELLRVPSDERQEFADNNIVEETTIRDLKERIEKKNEAIEALNKGFQDAEGDIAKLKRDKDEMQISKNNELIKERTRIKEFEKQISNLNNKLEKADNTEQIKEEISNEYKVMINDLQQEKSQAESKVKELEIEKSKISSVPAMKYQIYFDAVVEDFKNLMNALDELEKEDQATYEKCSNATIGLVNRFIAFIGGHKE